LATFPTNGELRLFADDLDDPRVRVCRRDLQDPDLGRTLATFVVGTARVTGLVFDGGATPIGETIPQNALLLPPGAGYDYVAVSDETGQISVDVPTAWRNVLGNGWHAHRLGPIPEGEFIGPGLNAARASRRGAANRPRGERAAMRPHASPPKGISELSGHPVAGSWCGRQRMCRARSYG
jgi:hypothetical protein